VGVQVAEVVVAAVLVDLAGAFADEQDKIPDFLFSKVTPLQASKPYLLFERSMKYSIVTSNEETAVATGSFQFNAILLAGKEHGGIVDMSD
jgi:hypothetical protein